MRRLLIAAALSAAACGGRETATQQPLTPAPKPSILLVTLDTTRADAIGPDAKGITTPAFNALAARGRRFVQAYATVPETFPSHISMMTGLYPAAHGIHENARYLGPEHAVIAERLRDAGYTTAAFVSGFPLSGRFGLNRGFATYDDEMDQGKVERSARETTDRALTWLQGTGEEPLFLWVHYFDPHDPYEPPEPFRSQYAGRPYHGEIAAMDEQLGRLVAAFEQKTAADRAIVVAGDHGEGLGDHGEAGHGNLLYQSVMRVPLLIVGPNVTPGATDAPVSIRRVFHTILDWAGLGSENSLRTDTREIVAGEAMKPYLSYGWQPQVMAVEQRQKAILAGRLEVYDIVADPGETRDLASSASLSREARKTLNEYPVPSLAPAPVGATLSPEEQRQLASLGYLTSDTKPVVRKDAPRAADMAGIFEDLDRASAYFVNEQYAQAIPVLQRILDSDPHNLMAALRLAAAHSAVGHRQEAMKSFHRAQEIAPQSSDVRHYLALHYLRSGDLQKAETLLQGVLAETPNRLTSIEAMATIREKQQRFDEALALRQQVYAARKPSAEELLSLGGLAMMAGNTPVARESLERARTIQGQGFRHDLELGVLYLDERRFAEARDALDRIPRTHPAWAMVLFKRAQVSVLLGEPDAPARIEAARRGADATTRELIAKERLFAR